VGTLSYSLACSAQWVYCTPSSGTSTGESDTIDVSYSALGLSEGIHFATIEINDPNAINSPQYIDVSLTVNPDTFDLVADVSPADSGVVTGSGPYFDGEVVTIEAFWNIGWAFDHWAGDDIDGSTTNPEQITMDSNKSVTAVMAATTRALTTNISPSGSGTVTGGSVYLNEETAQVEAFPNVGWVFDHWTGSEIDGSATNPEQVTMNADKTVTAVFAPKTHTVTIDVTPPASGTTTGGGTYNYGQKVAVQAFPNAGWDFDHWTGGGMAGSTTNPEQVIVDQDITVTAVFISALTLTVDIAPSGAGTATGGGTYEDGQVVTVQAFPAFRWEFSHWSGAEIDGSTTNPETVTVDSDKTVTALFFSDSVLTRIDLSYPQSEFFLYSAPVFTWISDGGTDNVYAVDLALEGQLPSFWSTLSAGPPLSVSSWQMPQAIWNVIPSGSYVYWRVRGADMDRTPLSIVRSAGVRRFYKY
jgi:hypothetical protein